MFKRIKDYYRLIKYYNSGKMVYVNPTVTHIDMKLLKKDKNFDGIIIVGTLTFSTFAEYGLKFIKNKNPEWRVANAKHNQRGEK